MAFGKPRPHWVATTWIIRKHGWARSGRRPILPGRYPNLHTV